MNSMNDPFINPKTLQIAINKQISIGGKFWCWHDWTYYAIALPRDVGEYISGKSLMYLCVKCGADKKFSSHLVEPIRL